MDGGLKSSDSGNNKKVLLLFVILDTKVSNTRVKAFCEKAPSR